MGHLDDNVDEKSLVQNQKNELSVLLHTGLGAQSRLEVATPRAAREWQITKGHCRLINWTKC